MRMVLWLIALLGPFASTTPAAAQPKVNIEQNFADSLTFAWGQDLGTGV